MKVKEIKLMNAKLLSATSRILKYNSYIRTAMLLWDLLIVWNNIALYYEIYEVENYLSIYYFY